MLSVPFALNPGTLIRIKMTEAKADAEVRYCTHEGLEYHIGSKWRRSLGSSRGVEWCQVRLRPATQIQHLPNSAY
jgi:hypothetical protein